MPVVSYKVGPGTLTLGTPAVAFSGQVRSATVKVTENVKTEEAIPMLDGSSLAESETATYKYTLVVTFQQDLNTNGIVDWTWDNAGQTKAFVYTPNTVDTGAVAGNLRVVPLDIGGDADTRPASEVTFAIIGTPVFTP